MTYKDNLFKIVDNFKNFKILVIGDIILDEYIWGKAGLKSINTLIFSAELQT